MRKPRPRKEHSHSGAAPAATGLGDNAGPAEGEAPRQPSVSPCREEAATQLGVSFWPARLGVSNRRSLGSWGKDASQVTYWRRSHTCVPGSDGCRRKRKAWDPTLAGRPWQPAPGRWVPQPTSGWAQPGTNHTKFLPQETLKTAAISSTCSPFAPHRTGQKA